MVRRICDERGFSIVSLLALIAGIALVVVCSRGLGTSEILGWERVSLLLLGIVAGVTLAYCGFSQMRTAGQERRAAKRAAREAQEAEDAFSDDDYPYGGGSSSRPAHMR